ncbi:MAG: carbon-nitrogen hydrolase family protein, partial [Anaerolineales bacterium]|nr:carbon-nitrogen hydrolase family protein [Anaerolineales bacterium]
MGYTRPRPEITEVVVTQFAIVQMRTLPLDPAANLKTVLARLDQAAAQGAELAVFPECALTGYFLSAEEAASVGETVPGPRTERLAEACRLHNVHAVVGTIENDAAGRCFNTAILVGPDG